MLPNFMSNFLLFVFRREKDRFSYIDIRLLLLEIWRDEAGGGGAQTDPLPQEKLPSKSPALLGMRHIRQSFAVAVIRGLKTDDKVAQ